MKKQKDPELDKAHKHCIFHRTAVEESTKCGCFYCLNVFEPKDITEWHKETRAEKVSGEKKEDTALCPHCGIDSVLGDTSGFPVEDKEFLEKMRHYFFDNGKIVLENGKIIN